MTTAGAFFESEPSSLLVNGRARVTVWMHSYCKDFAPVFWMIVDRGSSSFLADSVQTKCEIDVAIARALLSLYEIGNCAQRKGMIHATCRQVGK